ncbi:unnamed protein product [Adineta ricciae]|uniref:G-protein coupled receptors family 1 profile domain-containing protein n=1 Tax=Adineta ricciae TaxID=249248 RepID=A0A816BND6_ADIRI|nr:unnamed protein product [Adineta ricciae]
MKNNVTLALLNINDTNGICPQPLYWTSSAADNRVARLVVCIIATFTHSIFWLQLACCSSVRQGSMQWLYAYLITDLFLIIRYVSVYIVYTTTTDCYPNQSWVLFMYYFEVTFDNYLNILEVYILLALNICRYIQIAYNRNVYQLYGKYLFAAHVCIYTLPALSVLIQLYAGWCQLLVVPRNYCQVVYTNIYIQVFNVITAFALPIALNIIIIYCSVRHVRSASTMRAGVHHVSARQKYNRSLVIQFLVFYTIWLSLWSPNVIVFQVSITDGNVTRYVRMLNFIEIALDPIIIAALDVRFWQEWRRVILHLKANNLCNGTNPARVQPTTTAANIPSVKQPRLDATAL